MNIFSFHLNSLWHLGTSQGEGQQFLSSERFTQDPLEEHFARQIEAWLTGIGFEYNEIR